MIESFQTFLSNVLSKGENWAKVRIRVTIWLRLGSGLRLGFVSSMKYFLTTVKFARRLARPHMLQLR